MFLSEVGKTMLSDRMKKAEIAMLKVNLRALELGAVVSKPIFEGGRYDYVIETNGKLYRAQVKYADGKTSYSSGAVQVNLRRQIKKNRSHPYDESEIDVLLVYVPKIDKVCWFGPEVFNQRHNLSIRIAPARNGQIKGCIAAADYLW
jgi:PD-(D/E)XK endonuclease